MGLGPQSPADSLFKDEEGRKGSSEGVRYTLVDI